MRIDFHTHFVPPLPDFAQRYGDPRWPTFEIDGQVGRLTRDGVVVRTVPPSSWHPQSRLADMEPAGVDMQVLSPLPPLVCDWADPEPASQWCLRLNDGIAHAVAEMPGRFRGLGTVPLQHPDRAVRVLTRAREAGLSGVEVGTTAGAREFDHPDLAEFFGAAAELGMLVFVHPLILGAQAGWTARITGQAVTFGLGMTTDTAIAAAKLVFGGVVPKYPELRICLSHGGGTFAWALPRIARSWDAQGKRPCAELIRNIFVDSVVYSPVNLRYLRDVLGPDRLLFGTDYPLPAQDDLAGGVLKLLAAPDAELAGGGNAARLLGIADRPT
ncbi:MAG: amidohydrolase family protein [Actinomycetota bacterium]|nr:amidohydrolase family protein [Actinomycetota bacterium]